MPKIHLFLHLELTLTLAYLLLLQDITDRTPRWERIFQDHVDLFAETDEYLLGHFHLPRAILMELCNSLRASNAEPSTRQSGLSTTILAGTSHLGHCGISEGDGDRVGISHASVGGILPRVIDEANQLAWMYEIPIRSRETGPSQEESILLLIYSTPSAQCTASTWALRRPTSSLYN